jgi:hypothetical protein
VVLADRIGKGGKCYAVAHLHSSQQPESRTREKNCWVLLNNDQRRCRSPSPRSTCQSAFNLLSENHAALLW